MTDLDDLLGDRWPPPEIDALGSADVDDLRALAERHLRYRRAALRRIGRIDAAAVFETARIEIRRAELTAADRATVALSESGLTEIHRRILDLDEAAGRKASTSVKLIGGTLRSRWKWARTRRRIVDPDLWVKWAREERPDAVAVEMVERVTVDAALIDDLAEYETVDTAGGVVAVTLVCPSTGEAVPGVEALPPVRTFWVDDDGEESLS